MWSRRQNKPSTSRRQSRPQAGVFEASKAATPSMYPTAPASKLPLGRPSVQAQAASNEDTWRGFYFASNAGIKTVTIIAPILLPCMHCSKPVYGWYLRLYHVYHDQVPLILLKKAVYIQYYGLSMYYCRPDCGTLQFLIRAKRVSNCYISK